MTTTNTPRRQWHKRGQGEGSIGQRADGLWYGSLVVGRKADGKVDRRVVYSRSRQEVQRKLDELRRQLMGGIVTEPTRLTFGEHLTQWLRDLVNPSTRENNHRLYAELASVHIIPNLGGMKLTAIKPAHIQALYAAMLADGKATSTIRQVHTIIRRSLKQAADWRYIARNPAESATPPRVMNREMQPLEPTQVRAFIAALEADDHRLAPLWRFLFDGGCRPGEALALTWADVDLDNGHITIRRMLIGIAPDGSPRANPPETAKGRRTLSLTLTTVAALRAHRARQAEEPPRYGPDYAVSMAV